MGFVQHFRQALFCKSKGTPYVSRATLSTPDTLVATLPTHAKSTVLVCSKTASTGSAHAEPSSGFSARTSCKAEKFFAYGCRALHEFEVYSLLDQVKVSGVLPALPPDLPPGRSNLGDQIDLPEHACHQHAEASIGAHHKDDSRHRQAPEAVQAPGIRAVRAIHGAAGAGPDAGILQHVAQRVRQN